MSEVDDLRERGWISRCQLLRQGGADLVLVAKRSSPSARTFEGSQPEPSFVFRSITPPGGAAPLVSRAKAAVCSAAYSR